MKFRLYRGTDDQIPDPDLEAIYGIGNTPSYRGRAYVVFPLYDITAWKAIPQYQFEVVTGGSAVAAYDTMMSGTRAGLADDNGYAAIATDATDWVPIAASQLGFSGFPVFCDDRWVMVTNTQCAWTDDLTGLTGWQTGTVEPGPNTLQDAKYLGNGRILAAGLSGTLMLSVDKGESFSVIDPPNTGANISVIANTLGEAIIGSGSNENHLYTQDYGQSISTAANPATTYALTAGYYRYDQGGWYVGGGSSVPTGPGEITRLASPNATPITLVTDAPSQVVAMAYRPSFHIDGELCVALCHEGEIIYTTNDWLTYTISSASLPGSTTARPFAFDGQRFIIGYNGDAGEDAVVYTLTDPEVLQGPHLNTLQDNFAITTSFMGVEQVTSEPPILSDVVSWCHRAVGQPASEFDVEELDDIVVDGLAVAGAYTAKDVINSLQGLWQFDSPEYDRKIHYHLRGKPVVRVFTFDDLLEDPEESTREQAVEYPKKAHLDYQSPKVDYAPAKATSSRSSQDARVVGEVSIQTAVVFNDPDVPAQRVQVMHKVFWADADGETVIYVPDPHLDLVPGDCIGLSLRGTLRRLRIDKMEISPGVLKLTCRNDRETAYTSNAVGIAPPPPTPPPPSLAGPTMAMVLDTSLLRDADDGSALTKYIALGGVSPAWAGALLEESANEGTTYADLLQVTAASVMGTLTESIGASSPYYFDRTNKIVVQLDSTDESVDIDSLTMAQFLNEGGAWAIQDASGAVEIGQYRDAVDLGGGKFELSYLQRGRLNTGAVSHAEGARFVLLETVVPVRAPSSQLGVDMRYRATSFGRSTETGTVLHQIFEGNSQREWPVANVLPERVDANTISVRIVPRHRLGTVMAPLRSLNHDGYHWLVTDGVNTIDHRSLALTETFDVTGWSSPIEVSVAQVNRITQDGPAVTEEIA